MSDRLGAWFAFAILILGVFVLVYKSFEAIDRYWLDQQLDDRGKSTVGEVERILEGGGYKDWSDNLVYTYTVDGVDYEGWANGANGAFDSLYPTDEIAVEYLPEDPVRARMKGHRQGERDLTLLIVVLLIFAGATGVVYLKAKEGGQSGES